LQFVAAFGEANKVFNNLITAYKANLASCKAKRALPSLNALPALCKAKARAVLKSKLAKL